MQSSRLPVALATVAAALGLAACGAAATAGGTSASPSPSGSPRAGLRGGASGQLVQISGQTLILTGPNGDTTVTFTDSTTITKTSTAALADVTVGTCVVATGQKDATTGAITARTVIVSPMGASGCAARVIPTPSPNASPRPSFSPPPGGLANLSFTSGEVTAVNGTTVTLKTAAGASVAVMVPSTARVTKSAVVTAADLQTGQCLSASGPKDSSGNVQASALTITPAGPSGTCTTRGGGGFGGGGFGGGGFGGGGGGAPTGVPAGG